MTTPDGDRNMNLEDAVVARLRSEGLVRPQRRIGAGAWVASAAAILAFGGILATNVIGPRPDAQEATRVYVIAMYAGPEYPPLTSNDRRLDEHGRWAAAHQSGPARIVRGGPLENPIARFGPPGTATGRMVGYFTVRARTPADAIRLANSAPHIRHGGTVILYSTP